MTNFLSLPGEIRNRIYKMTVPVGRTYDSDIPEVLCAAPRIAGACREVREEVLSLWRGSNLFVLRGATVQLLTAQHFLALLYRSGMQYLPLVTIEINLQTQVTLLWVPSNTFPIFQAKVRIEGDKCVVDLRMGQVQGMALVEDCWEKAFGAAYRLFTNYEDFADKELFLEMGRIIA